LHAKLLSHWNRIFKDCQVDFDETNEHHMHLMKSLWGGAFPHTAFGGLVHDGWVDLGFQVIALTLFFCFWL